MHIYWNYAKTFDRCHSLVFESWNWWFYFQFFMFWYVAHFSKSVVFIWIKQHLYNCGHRNCQSSGTVIISYLHSSKINQFTMEPKIDLLKEHKKLIFSIEFILVKKWVIFTFKKCLSSMLEFWDRDIFSDFF